MKKLDIYSFGGTPASFYLVRKLNQINSDNLTKSCNVRMLHFDKNLSEIENLIDEGHLTVSVALNMLRLMRLDATKIALEIIHTEIPEAKFVSHLLKNVIIGRIKRINAKLVVIRKIEKNNVDIDKITAKSTSVSVTREYTKFYIKGHVAGILYKDNRYYRSYPSYSEVVDEITPSALMNKSIAKCKEKYPEDFF